MTIGERTGPAAGSGRAARAEAAISTAWVMTVSTVQLFVAVVLASTLTEELDISRFQLGALGAINTGVGAVLAPALGRIADRLGPRRSMVGVVIASAAGLGVTAVAFSYPMLVLASAIAGIPQGAGNSVTNSMIADEVAPGAQGFVTGVKQSGVQFAAFLSGATLPASAALVGWRPAVGVFAGFVLLSAAAVRGRSVAPAPTDRAADGAAPAEVTSSSAPGHLGAGDHVGATDPFVRQVALYALLLGLTAGGITRFYPLFAQEVLGFTEPQAGVAVSVGGLTAIVARLVWGGITDRLIPSRTALQLLAVGSAMTCGLLLAAETVGGWLLFGAVVCAAFSVVAWNVVAMLAVIRSVPVQFAGRATGVVLLGFLGGLTVSAPTVGYAVDRLGTYRPVWVVLGALALAGAAVAWSSARTTVVKA